MSDLRTVSWFRSSTPAMAITGSADTPGLVDISFRVAIVWSRQAFPHINYHSSYHSQEQLVTMVNASISKHF